jgi:signal peptidase I
MPGHDLFVIYLISVLLVLLPSFGLYKLFPLAGIEGWKAFVPFYNTWVMQEKAGRPKYWAVLQLFPIAGWFISMGIFIEWVKLFGRFSLLSHTLSALFPVFYFPYIASNKDTRFIGAEGVKKNYKKTGAREWIDAGVFAIVAATLIRSFVFEAYTIPTSSMEKTLLVNDFLFVSKLSYGPRIPNTPLAMPFVHHTLPLLNTKSYVEWIKIPYTRWFAKPVDRNDAVVFNFPAGDTLTKEYDSKYPYYDLVRARGRDRVWEDFTVVTRPVDKRENYIKRCVAVAGDSLQITDGILFINGKPAFVSPTSATYYNVEMTQGQRLDEESLKEAGVSLNQEDEQPDFQPQQVSGYKINLTLPEYEIVKKLPGVKSVSRDFLNDHDVYPYDTTRFKWSADNFGPIWVPKKGATISLTPENIDLYQRAIQVYENNQWEQRDGKVYLNGKQADNYTFKMDYYWMMGDNRHKSQDSRYWGFVPEDHVVGEAWLIWMSWEHGVRWKRLFSRIH